MTSAESEIEPAAALAGYAPGESPPLGGYTALMATFGGLAGGFGFWLRRSGRELPERIDPGDLALLTVASHKLARTIAKDRVTSPLRAPFVELQGDAGPGEVDESPRGRGLRRAVGQLLVCPYCVGLWSSAGLTAGYVVAPRPTRWISIVLAMFFGSEMLQVVYKQAENPL